MVGEYNTILNNNGMRPSNNNEMMEELGVEEFEDCASILTSINELISEHKSSIISRREKHSCILPEAARVIDGLNRDVDNMRAVSMDVIEDLMDKIRLKDGEENTIELWTRKLREVEVDNRELTKKLKEVLELNKMLTNDIEETKYVLCSKYNTNIV